MTAARDKILFWCLIATEAAGSQAILWDGIPVYRRLLSGGTEGAEAKDFVLITLVVIVMQAAHWIAFRLWPRLQFRRNVLLGHMLVFIGELSLFFVSALAALILFDRGADLEFALWKIAVLAAMLFALCCYKYQLAKLGDSMIEGQPDAATKWSSDARS